MLKKLFTHWKIGIIFLALFLTPILSATLAPCCSPGVPLSLESSLIEILQLGSFFAVVIFVIGLSLGSFWKYKSLKLIAITLSGFYWALIWTSTTYTVFFALIMLTFTFLQKDIGLWLKGFCLGFIISTWPAFIFYLMTSNKSEAYWVMFLLVIIPATTLSGLAIGIIRGIEGKKSTQNFPQN